MGNSMSTQHMMNSSMYKNIHSLKTEMPSDVLELFKANEIGYVRPVRKWKCRQIDPVTSATLNIVDMFPEPEMQVEIPPAEIKIGKLDKKRQEKGKLQRPASTIRFITGIRSKKISYRILTRL